MNNHAGVNHMSIRSILAVSAVAVLAFSVIVGVSQEMPVEGTTGAIPTEHPQTVVEAVTAPVVDVPEYTVGVEVTKETAEQAIQRQAYETLATLPVSGVTLSFNHPAIGNHLGGVRLIPGTSDVMINSARLAAEAQYPVADVVKHEVAHILTVRNMWDQIVTPDGYFAPGYSNAWVENVADCVALEWGATWTRYTSNCGGYEGAVDTILGR